ARSVTISRTMIGGQSHSSPMPEQSSNRIITEHSFNPPAGKVVKLKIKTQGEQITLWLNDREILTFTDPDPAAGKPGFGSVGTVRVRNINQWELITEYEKARREACIRDMHEFCKKIDTHYDADVRSRNRVEAGEGGLTWTWPATGATVKFKADGGRITAVVGA